MNSEQKGNVIIKDLWTQGTDCILDMRVVNMNTTLYIHNMSEKILAAAERDEKHKYLNSFLQQWRHFLCLLSHQKESWSLMQRSL